MAQHIQNPKTGKMAGSIGDGKTRVPTAAPRIPARTAAQSVGNGILFDQDMRISYQALRGVYTEYLATVDQLVADDLDDRTGSYDWGSLIRSISANGITEPIHIEVDKDGSQSIVNGCHRALLAWNLRLANIPVRYTRSGM